MHDLPIRTEQGRVGEAVTYQMQAHQPVVDIGEVGTIEPDHVDLNPLRRQVVHER